MAAVYKCPKCSATLKPANPIPAGKKIKCPKCQEIFDPNAEAAPKPAAVKKEEENLYLVKDEPPPEDDAPDAEGEDGKKKYSLADDLAKKKVPRNQKMVAQAICQRPSNQMLLTSSLMCLSSILSVMVVLWPLLFQTPESASEKAKAKKAKKAIPVEVQELDAVAQAAYKVFLMIVAACAVAAFLYNGLVAIGAVKMQSLESYTWGMIGSILLILPFNWMLTYSAFFWFMMILNLILGDEDFMFPLLTVFAISAWNVYIGVWNLITLRNPEVIAGFKAESATE
ncbi:MAG: hypothetical protein JNM56_34060 [Planctomycetia bacterium]|nr:hypothetical protein [Planctomycetia bacterium]